MHFRESALFKPNIGTKSRITIRVLHTLLAAKVGTAGILNAPSFAGVLCGTKMLLVPIGRVLKERNTQTQKHNDGNSDFQSRIHSIHLQ